MKDKARALAHSLDPKRALIQWADDLCYRASIQTNPCRKVQFLLNAQHHYRIAQFHATADYLTKEIDR